jgi:hypothetical protein
MSAPLPTDISRRQAWEEVNECKKRVRRHRRYDRDQAKNRRLAELETTLRTLTAFVGPAVARAGE